MKIVSILHSRTPWNISIQTAVLKRIIKSSFITNRINPRQFTLQSSNYDLTLAFTAVKPKSNGRPLNISTPNNVIPLLVAQPIL